MNDLRESLRIHRRRKVIYLIVSLTILAGELVALSCFGRVLSHSQSLRPWGESVEQWLYLAATIAAPFVFFACLNRYFIERGLAKELLDLLRREAGVLQL